MNFRLQITESDYVKLNEFHMGHTKAGKAYVMLPRYLVGVVAFIVVAVMYFLNVNRIIVALEAVALAGISVIWAINTPLFMAQMVRSQLRKLPKGSKLPYPPVAELEFGEEEITEISENETIHLKYEDIIVIYEWSGLMLINYGEAKYMLVPIRCLDERYGDVKALLAAKGSSVHAV